MIDLNEIRREFAAFLHADPTRWRMDAALAHVVQMAYQAGLRDAPTAAREEVAVVICEASSAATALDKTHTTGDAE